MTRQLVLAFVAACGETTSTNDWPPGPTLHAVASGDLDGDGNTDLVFLAQRGFYVAYGTRDIGLHASPIERYSSFVPTSTPTLAAAIVPGRGGEAFLVTASSERGQLVLETRDRELGVRSSLTLGAVPTRTWLAVLDGVALAVAIGDEIALVDVDRLGTAVAEPAVLSPPSGRSWAGAVNAFSYPRGANTRVVVVSPQTVFASDLAVDGTPIAWEERRNGAAWTATATIDLDGNARPEVLGVDATSPALCAIDVEGATGESCLTIDVTTSGGELAIGGGAFEASQPASVFVMESIDAARQHLRMYSRVRITSGALQAETTTDANLFQGVSPIHLRVIEQDAARGLLIADSTGTFVYCLRANGGAVDGCD